MASTASPVGLVEAVGLGSRVVLGMLGVLSLPGGLGAQDAGPVVPGHEAILVTAFGPFAGRGSNGSATVAVALDGRSVAGHAIHILVMPVVWGQPEQQVPPAVARWHPILLLGLGEGYPDRIAVEMAAHNRADPTPDDNGRSPPSTLLLPGGAERRRGSLHFDPLWPVMPPIPIVVSEDAGGYLCNACFYTALGCAVQRCGFIHLPPQAAVADADYVTSYASIVLSVIAHNLPDHAP